LIQVRLAGSPNVRRFGDPNTVSFSRFALFLRRTQPLLTGVSTYTLNGHLVNDGLSAQEIQGIKGSDAAVLNAGFRSIGFVTCSLFVMPRKKTHVHVFQIDLGADN
jgi:hypothetical protein